MTDPIVTADDKGAIEETDPIEDDIVPVPKETTDPEDIGRAYTEDLDDYGFDVTDPTVVDPEVDPKPVPVDDETPERLIKVIGDPERKDPVIDIPDTEPLDVIDPTVYKWPVDPLTFDSEFKENPLWVERCYERQATYSTID